MFRSMRCGTVILCGALLALTHELPTDLALKQLASSINNQGAEAEADRRYAEAEKYFRRALSLIQKGDLESDGIAGLIGTNLAVSIEMQGRLDEPRALYISGLATLAHAFGESSPEYGKALCNFGLFEYQLGNYAAALPLQEKAYQIESSSPSVSNREKGKALNNVAMTLLDLGRGPEAEPLLYQALALHKSAAGTEIDMALTLNNIATLEERAGRFTEARRDENEALQIAVQRVRPNDLLLPTLWTNLGEITAREGHLNEAKALYQRALDAWLRTEGKQANYAATLFNMASIEAKKGHHRLARTSYREALAIDEAVLGPNHPRVAKDLVNFGTELCLERKFRAAAALFQRAEVIQEKTFGRNNLRVAATLRMLGVAYAGSKQLQEAEQAYRNALDLSRPAMSNSPELVAWLSEYATVLSQEQKFALAEKTFVEANGLRVRNAIAASKGNLPTGI